MGQLIIETCKCCHQEAELEWQIDFDSSPLEPQFHKVCHTCGGFNYD